MGSRGNISTKNGNPSLRRKAGTSPSAEGKAGAERENSRADCRTTAEEYERESREGTQQDQVMKDPFFLVLCTNSSGSQLCFSSKVWLCSRLPEATPGKDLGEVWYRPRVGTAALRLKGRL